MPVVTESKPIATVKELAELVDRRAPTVYNWLRDDRWPFARKPPWSRKDLPRILRWVGETLTHSPEAQEKERDEYRGEVNLKGEKLRAEVRRLTAQADLAELELARARGELVAAADVEREWADLLSAFRNNLQNLTSQIVPLALQQGLPHGSVPAFGRQVGERIELVLRMLADPHGEEAQGEGHGQREDDPGAGAGEPGAR